MTQPPTPPLTLWRQVQEDWMAHGRDWTRPGFRAVAVHRFGNWRLGVQPRWLRAPLSVFYGFLFRYVRNHYGIELPYTVRLGRRVIFEHQHGIVVHGGCVIGDDCILRQGVTLGNQHLSAPSAAPTLGRAVNVGAGAKILGAITLGDEVNVGANAVVLCDVPDGATVVGIPGRLVRQVAPTESVV